MSAGQMQPQQYCLRWNNHQHNLLSVFEDLLNHEAFVDVTLACDGLQLKAHKMVLSACSPYFQSMLYNTPDRHPIVFLRDVRYHEMKALLEFMYRGEVSVDQENLSSLLKVAEGLKIKGLAEVNDQAAAAVAAAAESSIKAPQPPPTSSHGGHPLSHFNLHGFPGLLSPHALESAVANSLASKLAASSSSISPPPSLVSALNVGPSFLGPKRKRGRPRRLSGSEAVPMASGLSENGVNPMDTEDLSSVEKMEKGMMRESSGDVSPIKDTKPTDLMSEADSIDGRTSGLLSPKKETNIWSPQDFSRTGVHHQQHQHDEGVSEVSCEPDVKPFLDLSKKQEQPQQHQQQQQKPPQPQQKQLQIAESEEIARKRAKLRADNLTSTFATLSPISSTGLSNCQQPSSLSSRPPIVRSVTSQPSSVTSSSSPCPILIPIPSGLLRAENSATPSTVNVNPNGKSVTVIDASSRHRTIILQDATVTALHRPERLDSADPNHPDISSPASSESGMCEHDSSTTLEYTQNEDGSCTCKICAEVVPSRTHWYRHKYKVHNAALFRCEKCEIFFKSKKGYGGHIQNRHSPKAIGSDGRPKSKKEMEGLNKVLKELQTKKESEMVQRIIAQVKAECEASGGDIERRGYTKHY